jgi:hypothetical protein
VVKELVGEIIFPDAAAGVTVGTVAIPEEGEGGAGNGLCLGAGGEKGEWAGHGTLLGWGRWGSLAWI